MLPISSLHIKRCFFSELSLTELYQILQARVNVFVVEQACCYPDLDDQDQASWHLQVRNDQNQLIGYARVLPPGLAYAEASIGRFLVIKPHRSAGIGKHLFQEAMRFCNQKFPEPAIRICAQEYLLDFYRRLGFKEASAPFLDYGIRHVEMLLVNPRSADNTSL